MHKPSELGRMNFVLGRTSCGLIKRWVPMIRTIAVGLAILASWPCRAAEPPPPEAVVKVIHSACPGGVISDGAIAFGDMNADSRPDVAAIVSCKDPSDLEIMLLEGKSDGSFQLHSRSQVWTAHHRRWDGVKIENGVLIYSQGCAAACTNPWTGEFKFKKRKGDLVLIGEEHADSGDPKDSPTTGLLEHGYFYGQSINWITQEVIYWRRSETRQLEKRLKFRQTPTTFSEFSFDSETPKARELSGFINEDFELVLFQ